MYSINHLQKFFENPNYLPREINRLYHSRLFTRNHNPCGIDIFEEDWDNLVILDACRFDIFEEETNLTGNLHKKRSRASTTRGWITANFSGRDLHDTVYITGNSHYSKLQNEINSQVYALYNVFSDLEDRCTDIFQKTIECSKEHPNKRMITHFIPPHHPYIGPTAEKLLPQYDQQEQGNRHLFHRIESGEFDISDEQLRTMYRENLNRVLPHVKSLIEQLNGKTVISADHGDLLGDRTGPIPIKTYGHPRNYYVPKLVEVPWQICHGDRREIIAEEPINQDDVETTTEELEKQLESLGYK